MRPDFMGAAFPKMPPHIIEWDNERKDRHQEEDRRLPCPPPPGGDDRSPDDGRDDEGYREPAWNERTFDF